MGKAYSPKQVLNMKRKMLHLTGEWFEAFGTPEQSGVWFISGDSGNGKTSFVIQLALELSRFGQVLIDSMEEGLSASMQNHIRRFNLQEARGRVKFLDCESIDDLTERLLKPKSPAFVIIDSFQHSQLTYKSYLEFKKQHRNKLIIFISQVDGHQPAGRSAKRVMFDASLKIWVEGYRAISKGRYIGPRGYYTIWQEGADRYGWKD